MADSTNTANPDNLHVIPHSSKLDELASKSTKSNGITPHYILANQALKDDLLSFLTDKSDNMQCQINALKREIVSSRKREQQLEEQIKILKETQNSLK